MTTVLITGCSSGYGLETARYFHAQGWNVIAGMRTPRADVLRASGRLRVLALDVTKAASIAAALAQAGPVDVLVNNAGIGLFGAAEATPMTTIRDIFETNTFGMMAMAQALIPRMREQGSGVIVNVTSSAVLAPFPLVAAYTASKTAIEGYTASLGLEVAQFGLKVKLVQPGYGPGTSFAANAGARLEGMVPEAYAAFAQTLFSQLAQISDVTTAQDVAAAVWRAATDGAGTLRYPAGADAVALAQARC